MMLGWVGVWERGGGGGGPVSTMDLLQSKEEGHHVPAPACYGCTLVW